MNVSAENEAKLAIIDQINAAIVGTNDPEERKALVGLLLNPELEIKIVREQPRFINYSNIGHRYDYEDKITARDEKLISTLMGL